MMSIHPLFTDPSTGVGVDVAYGKKKLVASTEVDVERSRAGDEISRVVTHSISDCMRCKRARPLLRPF